MSDDEYSYHYSDEDEDMGGNNSDDNSNNNGSEEEEEEFEYTDDDEDDEPHGGDGDDMEMNLENTYYNAKGLRDSDTDDALEMFESLIRMEHDHLNDGKNGDENDDDSDGMEDSNETNHKVGQWTYKSLKQMTKIKIGDAQYDDAQKIYQRLLECIANPCFEGVFPNAIEKGVNGMLDRVSAIFHSSTSGVSGTASESANIQKNNPQDLANLVYASTIKMFHPRYGTSSYRNERLWFKTTLKYGQLLYENHNTYDLQNVISDLIQNAGLPNQNDANAANSNINATSSSSSSSTQLMEIYALQIQLYSRLKDNAALRDIFQKAMRVQGGIPHPRTLARIQEIGGKMHMASAEYESACTTFFQAFKSYDEAGDVARLRCLKYLVMASMLHASSINPFDSQEVRPYKKDPEIVAMTNLVDAFHNNDIQEFERILKDHHDKIMNDEFIQEHIADLLKTIRTQVLLQVVRPYTRISLKALSKCLNGIPVKDVESLLVPLILDGKLEGRIHQVKGVLVKNVTVGAKSGSDGAGGDSSNNQGSGNASTSASASSSAINYANRGGMYGSSKVAQLGHDSIGMKTMDAIENLIGEIESLTSSLVSSAAKAPENSMEGLRA